MSSHPLIHCGGIPAQSDMDVVVVDGDEVLRGPLMGGGIEIFKLNRELDDDLFIRTTIALPGRVDDPDYRIKLPDRPVLVGDFETEAEFVERFGAQAEAGR